MRKIAMSVCIGAFILQACAQNQPTTTKDTKVEKNITTTKEKYTLKDYLSTNEQLDKDVDAIIAALNDRALVAQLIMPAVGRLGLTNEVIEKQIKDTLIGGVLMLNGTKEEFTKWISTYNEINPYSKSLPFLYSADAEPSLVNRKIIGSTPVSKANEMKDIDEVIKFTTIISKDLNAIGINYNFSPVVDMSPNKTVGFRSFGANPENIIPWSNAFIQETQKNNIIATAKHFPGHGLVSGDTHKALQMIDGELKEIGNYPKLIEDGVLSIMVAHIAVKNNPEYDTKGLPSTLSPEIVQHLLREKFNFKGLIVTDAMNMGGVNTIPNAEVKAIEAGCDIVLMPMNIEKAHASILKKVKEDAAFKAKVTAAAKRIVRMKLCTLK
ncbi:MAG: glycoside hydrolase family 3 protein [Crocinitomicaceae bacterium]|nr:glycoside hydrolase family 3 protein [Crocinitomicaceae bacterium]